MARFATRLLVLGLLIGSGFVVTRWFGDSASVPVMAAMPTQAEARAIFYALLEERTAAVEMNDYSKIEPLYSHDETLVVFRPDLKMHGWKAVEAYWRKSLSRKRTEPFRVYWNDDLSVTIQDDLIVGGLTWSNQAADRPRNYGCLSLALRRVGDRWRIVHEHSSNWTKPSA